MSSASHPDLSFPEVAGPILTGPVIDSISIISSLLDYFSQMKQSLPPRNDDKAQVSQKAGDFPGDIARAKSLPVKGRGDESRKKKDEKGGPRRSRSDGKEAIDNSIHEDLNVLLSDQIERLNRDLVYVKDELDKHRKIEGRVGELIKDLIQRSKAGDSKQTPGAAHVDSEKIQDQLSAVAEIVTKLKLHIPPSHKILSSTSSDAHRGAQAANEFGDYKEMPDLAVEHKFLGSSVYKNLRSTYDLLDTRSKLCLLCFAVFPEHAKIKKRTMYYWWIGEGLIDSGTNTSVGDILKEFVDKGFIQPAVKKHWVVTTGKSYRMLPLIRSMVVILAKEAGFFEFDSRGCPTANFSKCLRSCLVRSKEASLQKVMAETQISDLEKLHTLFNVNEPYLDFKVEWFSNMKNINSLSLGSWQGSKKDHIEVENTEFLRGLKHMKHLKLLSLQGISRITELPDSIGKLYNLRILDLRACHSLESLPDEVCSLKELVRLDVSGCHLLEYMPKGVASLVKLEVLMGFVVSDIKSRSYCTVHDLAKLKKLRKLGLRTSRREFPSGGELTTLQQLYGLRKLTIEWGEIPIPEKGEGTEPAGDARSKSKCISGLFPFRKCATQKPTADEPKLFENLEKLDLLCYPLTTPPLWLLPEKFENLKSLYFRGGRLHHLGQVQGDKKWKVTTMRLLYLNELTMDWREMRRSFPELVCLQTVDCPKLTLLPCNKNGMWLKEQFSESNHEGLSPRA